LKRAERESFLKSFSIFFVSLWTLSATLIYFEHAKNIHDLNEKIYSQMRLCSFDLKCEGFEFDFEPLVQSELHSLKESKNGLYALFAIPKNENYALKISISQDRYERVLEDIAKESVQKLLFASLIIVILSALFSMYALYPLRKALSLTEEFSRDILHDLSTPLAAIRLNLGRLKVASGDEKKIERIETSVESIIALGENLKSYLCEHQNQIEPIEIYPLLKEQIETYQKLYPHLKIEINDDDFCLDSNKDALKRVFDNILSNACKYNKEDGWVKISISRLARTVTIEDGGIGMYKPQMAFERFYKEGERGVGIGLHIVKKLCDSLGVKITIDSKPNIGTKITLDMKATMTKRKAML